MNSDEPNKTKFLANLGYRLWIHPPGLQVHDWISLVLLENLWFLLGEVLCETNCFCLPRCSAPARGLFICYTVSLGKSPNLYLTVSPMPQLLTLVSSTCWIAPPANPMDTSTSTSELHHPLPRPFAKPTSIYHSRLSFPHPRSCSSFCVSMEGLGALSLHLHNIW